MLPEKIIKKYKISFKMLEFNPLYYKKNHVRKYHLIFFFWNFIEDFFFFSEVLYERSCSTKGAAQELLDVQIE